MGPKLDLKKKEVTIVSIPSAAYKKKEMEIVKYLAEKYKRICYVNLTRQFPSLIKTMQNEGIKEDGFLFIDAVTKKVGEGHAQCIHLGSPEALTNLSITIKKSLGAAAFDTFLFDSLSTLLTYHKVDSLTKFVHDLFAVVKDKDVAAVFTIQKGTNSDLMADISMFADRTIEVE